MKIILLETSPVMLIESIIFRNEYKNSDIEIHEKSNLPGGSWKSVNFIKSTSIDSGSHIFAPWKNRKLYNKCLEILEKKLQIKTYFLKTRPENIFNPMEQLLF